MRGDSLRDFYAKSLALLGLAALAGIGALVDYWPTDLAVPRDIARALPQPDPAASAPRFRSMQEVARFVAERTPAPVVARVAVMPLPVEITDSAAGEIVMAEVEMPAPAPMPVAFEVSAATSIPATALALYAPLPPPLPVAPPAADLAIAEPVTLAPPSAPVDQSPVQMVTGALAWTGQSILHTGAKAGATIKDAFRAFGGAFRKVPWFNSAPASRPIG